MSTGYSASTVRKIVRKWKNHGSGRTMSEVVYREENYEVVKSGRTFEVVRTTAGVKTIIQSGESLEDAKLTIANDRKWTEQ